MYFPICDCERQKKDCKLSPWTCGKVNRIFLCSANAKLSYRAPGLAHSRQQSSRTLSAPTRVTELNIRIWQALHVLPPKGELSYIVGRKTPLLHATQVHQTWKCVENECLQGKKSSCVVEAACVAQIFSHRAFFWCIMLRGSLMTLIWDDKASCSPSSSLKTSSVLELKLQGLWLFISARPLLWKVWFAFVRNLFTKINTWDSV